MRILILILLISTFSYSQSKLNIEEIEKYIIQSMQDWKIPGLAISIVKNDSIILSKGFGVREINKNELVDENTIFGIASLTKGFTSFALGQLKDSRLIDFNDKVRKHITYFELYNPYVSSEFTIRDLLCHRSGLKTFSGDLLWYASNYSRKEIIERAKFLQPAYGFREHYGYSNVLYLTAGEIIPAVSNQSWDEYISNNIFKPLNMKNSSTSISNFKTENIAKPHTYIENNPYTIEYVNWDNIAPAGAINSNAKDMANWLIMLNNYGTYNGNKLISKNTLFELWQANTPIDVSQSDNYLYPSLHFHSYGLGWDLFDLHGKKIINHSGGLDGMISHICIVPEEKFGFVVLTNSSNYLPDALMYYILDNYFNYKGHDYSKLYKRYFDLNNENKNSKKFILKNKSKSIEDLKKYTGNYKSELYGNALIELKNDKLFIKFIPTPDFFSFLEIIDNNTFKIKLEKFPSLPEGTAHFILNVKQEVEELRIDIPNPDFDFTELKFFKQSEKND